MAGDVANRRTDVALDDDHENRQRTKREVAAISVTNQGEDRLPHALERSVGLWIRLQVRLPVVRLHLLPAAHAGLRTGVWCTIYCAAAASVPAAMAFARGIVSVQTK